MVCSYSDPLTSEVIRGSHTAKSCGIDLPYFADLTRHLEMDRKKGKPAFRVHFELAK